MLSLVEGSEKNQREVVDRLKSAASQIVVQNTRVEEVMSRLGVPVGNGIEALLLLPRWVIVQVRDVTLFGFHSHQDLGRRVSLSSEVR